MNYFQVLSLVLLLTRKAVSNEVDCEFRVKYSNYQCLANILRVEDNNEQEFKVTGTHLGRYNNEKVQAFASYNLSLASFPQALQKTFPNLHKIEIDNAGLTAIFKDDLKLSGEKLKFLSLRLNKISKLASDLFMYNPNLETLDLYGNQISKVGSDALLLPIKLTSIDFENNVCHSAEAINDRIKVLELIEKISEKC